MALRMWAESKLSGKSEDPVEKIQDTAPDKVADGRAELDAPPAPPKPVPIRQMLPPKGACWYCEKPLDSVRRFCGKACADSFVEEM
jgi:hypothetical protein